MNRDGMVGFLSVNRTVTNLKGEFRHLRLPRMNPFPKLDRAALPVAVASPVAARRPGRGPMILEGGADVVPEIATDLVSTTHGCAVENVKRGAGNGWRWRSWARVLGWRP